MKPASYLLAYFLLLGAGAGCVRHPAAHYQPLATAVAPTSAPQLLFFSGRLSAGAAGTRLEVLHLEAVPGGLKIPPAETDTPDFLRVTQLDTRGQALAQVRLPHPLRHTAEHLADDQRTLARSEIQVPVAEFFVRLALQPGATALRVEEVVASKTTMLAELPITSN